ncbi:MAG TPA: hypothetical protein VMF89_17985, partial [Polyangiales bacterium]|nr:hypothetical protein [Polyangiales bacterium]
MLRALLIDGFDSAELVAALETFVTSKGKPLRVFVLPQADDLTLPQTYKVRLSMSECLAAVRELDRARSAQVVEGLEVMQVDDEAQLPLRVAARIGASANVETALTFYLRQRHTIEASSVVSASGSFRGAAWRELEGLAELSGVMVPVPVEGSVTLRADGSVSAVSGAEPAPEAVAEARSFVLSLVQHGQVHTHTQRGHGSHEVVTDAQGQRRLVRLRTGTH